MTTAAAQQGEMVERKGTRLYQWQYAVNETVEGVLVARGIQKFTVEENGKKEERTALGFKLETPDGPLKMLATYDLADKITAADLGHRVVMRYTGEENIGSGRKMKRFYVAVSRAKVAQVADLSITDEDIPF